MKRLNDWLFGTDEEWLDWIPEIIKEPDWGFYDMMYYDANNFPQVFLLWEPVLLSDIHVFSVWVTL